MSHPKSVLITGCSDGTIGSALALTFLQRGYHVFASARNVKKMAALEDHANVTLLSLDVTKSDDVAAAVAAVKKANNGTLNILVNHAGRPCFRPFLDQDLTEARELFELNLFGTLAMCQAFAPFIIKAKGAIVNVVGSSGRLNVPYMGVYSASKSSQEIMGECLRLELMPFGVRVINVVTNMVQTHWHEYGGEFDLPDGSLYKPVEDKVKAGGRGENGFKRMDPMVYAKQVVNRVEGGVNGTIWHGGGIWLIRTMLALMPTWMIDNIFIKMSGLDVLKSMQ